MSGSDVDCGLPGDRLFRAYPRAAVAALFALLTTPLWLRLVLVGWNYWSNK